MTALCLLLDSHFFPPIDNNVLCHSSLRTQCLHAQTHLVEHCCFKQVYDRGFMVELKWWWGGTFYESMMKAASKTYFLTISSWTYHHVKMKRVLGIEVLQLAQNRENFLLPHFNEDHFMDQHRDLESQDRKKDDLF